MKPTIVIACSIGHVVTDASYDDIISDDMHSIKLIQSFVEFPLKNLAGNRKSERESIPFVSCTNGALERGELTGFVVQYTMPIPMA